VIVGGGGTIVKALVLMTTWLSAFTTVTSRAPSAAAVPTVMATDSWVGETKVVEFTMTSAPNDALAPDWKLLPVTETVRLAPGAALLGDTLEIAGRMGRFTLVLAEVPSAKLAVSVNVDPVVNGVGVRSDANMKNAPPSATGKLTVPPAAFRSALSRLAVAPSAQYGVAGSVSQMPPPLARRRSRRVTVRGHIPPCTITRNVPSRVVSGAKAVGLGPTLSLSLPRNARLIVGGGGKTVKLFGRV
jgi:hypothetical protein